MDIDDPRAEAWRRATRLAITDAGITMTQLAARLGVTRQGLNNWLLGTRQPPEPDTVFAIETALNCPGRLSRLLGYQPADQIPIASLDTDLFRRNERGELGTRTATPNRDGMATLRRGTIYQDPRFK